MKRWSLGLASICVRLLAACVWHVHLNARCKRYTRMHIYICLWLSVLQHERMEKWCVKICNSQFTLTTFAAAAYSVAPIYTHTHTYTCIHMQVLVRFLVFIKWMLRCCTVALSTRRKILWQAEIKVGTPPYHPTSAAATFTPGLYAHSTERFQFMRLKLKRNLTLHESHSCAGAGADGGSGTQAAA